MKLVTHAEGALRKPPAPNSPTVTVIFDGTHHSTDVGLVKVSVPGGAMMAAHKHSGSDVILTPIIGMVRIAKGEEIIDVHVGDSALVLKDEAVSLSNPDDSPAEVLVAAGPANFVTGILDWPTPDRA